jgi:hypothetical protein
MRLVWWVIGVGAAVLFTLNALFLIGFTAMEVVSPDSIESSGPSPWLVVTPWMLGLFVVARWSLRRAGGPPRDGSDAGPPAISALQGWVEAHPLLSAAIAGGALGVLWSLIHGWLVGLVVAVVVASTSWFAGRVRQVVGSGPAPTRSVRGPVISTRPKE